jgi:polyisoprenoid-binding protein YceI
MSKVPSAGFDASVTLLRSDFGMANYVPVVSDQVKLQITMEARQAKQ